MKRRNPEMSFSIKFNGIFSVAKLKFSICEVRTVCLKVMWKLVLVTVRHDGGKYRDRVRLHA